MPGGEGGNSCTRRKGADTTRTHVNGLTKRSNASRVHTRRHSTAQQATRYMRAGLRSLTSGNPHLSVYSCHNPYRTLTQNTRVCVEVNQELRLLKYSIAPLPKAVLPFSRLLLQHLRLGALAAVERQGDHLTEGLAPFLLLRRLLGRLFQR